MIPIRSKSSVTTKPFVTWLIMLICTAVSFRIVTLPVELALGALEALSVVPSRFMSDPLSPEQLVTLVSSAFLHAGWLHLGGNLLFLWVFGPSVEDRLGHTRYLFVYLACAAAGAAAHIAVYPESAVPVVGASGAIAGVLGAHLILDPKAEITTIVPIPFFFEIASLPAAFVIGIWFLMQVASGLVPLVPGEATQVAWFAHLGGFAAGCLLVLDRWMSAPLGKTTKTRSKRTGSRKVSKKRAG